LAGANHPPDLPTDPADFDKSPDDGILTADEIAFLPLGGLDLVTLSACETGLGQVAGGEGLLGIQRAFQIAGTRTTVASLWKVNDDATRVLMGEFYKNLWQKKLPKIEALRQAQLAMLNDYDPEKQQLRGAGEAVSIDPKKLSKSGIESKEQSTSRTPPLHWAAFVLSGDWR
jgi:CHAT domain-containing protein